MLKVKPETVDALMAGRVRVLAHFDFMFLPIRVNNGDVDIEWEGHTWHGVGDTLTDHSVLPHFTQTHIGSGSNIGESTLHLPWGKDTSEVATKGYYLGGRGMTVFLCSYDDTGTIIERFGILPYTIVECSSASGRVSFTARDRRLTSKWEREELEQADTSLIRDRFKWGLTGSWNGVLVIVVNVVFAALGSVVGTLSDIMGAFVPARRRSIIQRWHARRNTYWFKTQPDIPRIVRRKRGYKVKADTLKDAKDKLFREVFAKVWLVPRNGHSYESYGRKWCTDELSRAACLC